MDTLLDPQLWIAFSMLTAMEIVLGIDNIIFISVLVARVPAERRDLARKLGLGFAMVSRLLLLLSLGWVMGLRADLFHAFGQGVSGRDLVLLVGGLFLLWKAAHEIFNAVESTGAETHAFPGGVAAPAFWAVIGQIAVIDIVFSLDSVITAVGMVDHIGVMVAAVVVSVMVMLLAARPIGEFVDRHPSVKILALAFLVMIGATLVADAFGVHVPKGYLYAAMGFSLGVELLNLRARRKSAAAAAAGEVAC